MSRTTALAPGQLTTPSRNIFVTLVTQSDGTKKQVMSSQPLCDTSIRINTRNNRLLFLTSMALSGLCGVGNLPNPYLQLSVINRLTHYCGTVPDVWTNVFNFLPGFTQSVGNYGLSIIKPSFFKSIAANLDPFIVVDAAMRGQEGMVMNTLRADPSYLLRVAKVKNSVDVEFEVMPLEAAIIANDVQMVEKMREHFARLTTDLEGNPIDGLAEMHRQIKETYKKSLQRYCDIQQEKINTLQAQQALQANGQVIDAKALGTAQARLSDYSDALESNKFDRILKAHEKAQEHNTFDFQPYVDAILHPNLPEAELDDVMALIAAKTEAETQAAIAKGVSPIEIGFTKDGKTYTREEVQALPFDQLTLIQKLNRFREAFVKHKQREMIDNSEHILAGLNANLNTWNTLPDAQDPHYKKRDIIWSQLVGWAQRHAAEPVKQDIRQGTYYLTEENELRARPSRFNSWDGANIARCSVIDCSISASLGIDGVGYKFAVAWIAAYSWGATARGAMLRAFSKLMSSKNNKLGTLMRQPSHKQKQNGCPCIVS